MDGESATTVALPFLLRGRWHNIQLQFYIVHAWMCGKVHRVENVICCVVLFP